MTIEKILNYIHLHFTGLHVFDVWGEKSFFYNPEGLFKRGIYFCTLKTKDGENDKASHLDRDGIFRVNFGISKATFLSIFHSLPQRPTKGSIIEGSYDFTKLDMLTPHPVYGWMAWVSVLNPTPHTWQNIMPLLEESYALCCKKYAARITKDSL